MSLIHSLRSFLDGYLPRWTEETLKREESDSISQLLEGLRNTSPRKWKQITSTLPSIPSLSVVQVVCVSDHNSPLPGGAGDPDTPEVPSTENHPRASQRGWRCQQLPGICFGRRKAVLSTSWSQSPLSSTLARLNLTTLWLTCPSSTNGATPQVHL